MWRPPTGRGGAPPVRVFDYSYYDEYQDKNGQVRQQWHYFTCALVRHDGSWPQLRVAREGLVDKAEHLHRRGRHRLRVRGVQPHLRGALRGPALRVGLHRPPDDGDPAQDRRERSTSRPWAASCCSAPTRSIPPVMPRLLAMAEDVLAHVPAGGVGAVPHACPTPGGEDLPAAAADGDSPRARPDGLVAVRRRRPACCTPTTGGTPPPGSTTTSTATWSNRRTRIPGTTDPRPDATGAPPEVAPCISGRQGFRPPWSWPGPSPAVASRGC